MDSIVTPSIENDAKDAAHGYIARGWFPLPIPRGEKGCKLPDWQDLRIKAGEVEEFFTEGSNVGLLLGDASGGLTDIDLDCPEAINIGSKLLPSTLRSGRGLGDAHYWYVSPVARRSNTRTRTATCW
ncbi:MAG TPA: bifunctional DNA primase/polymerase [Rubrobacter sp.]|nr:bifunctional DNA primase/polymerase [Rubrobacter sp.]